MAEDWTPKDNWSPNNHNHDDAYSAKSHNHDTTYSKTSHDHDTVYSKLGHLHDDRYSQTSHNHDAIYSKLGHVHDYAASNHNHDAVYSKLGHNHTETVGYPNYAEVVELGALSSWTATDDGWVSLTHYAKHIVWDVYVDNVLIGVEGGEETQSGLSFLPVTRGNVVSATAHGDSSTSRTVTFRFFPKK